MRISPIGPLLYISLAAAALAVPAAAQMLPGVPPAAAPAPILPAPAADPLGRSTPRGTVMGFLSAGRKGDDDIAGLYLNTPRTARDAGELAHQMYVVLEARLPARLTQVSDAAEGSRANPVAPEQERIGTIAGPAGPLDVIVERVTRPKEEPIWLFAAQTLDAIPAVYDDIVQQRANTVLPHFLTDTRIGNVRLYEWLAILLGLPAFYYLTVLLNRALAPVLAFAGRRLFARLDGTIRNVLPRPARLLLMCIASRWLLSTLPLSLLVRQRLSNIVTVVGIAALVWLLMLFNREGERYATRRIPLARLPGTVSLLRVGRRMLDMFAVLAGVLATLRHFGIDPTPLLAGLGVGGIAVALAAQKTLENVIAGASLIFDQALRIGEFVRIGAIEGAVDHIGLRSTRIRTLDRSIVSVPNSQIANMVVETLSARDKFWFHPTVALRYETTTEQLQVILAAIRQMLTREAAVDTSSIRVRFLRLGAFSLDIEVFAYVAARDWPHFLEIQQGLLMRIPEIVGAAGTRIALPPPALSVGDINATTR